LKQVRDDMIAKLVKHNERSANLENVVVMRQNCYLVDAYRENNYLKAKLDGSHIDVSPLKSLHNNMSDKDCHFCLVVMEDLAKLRNVHAQVANQLESTICELDELKARPSLLGACLECPKLKHQLDARSLNVKKLETELLEKSHVSVTSSPCEVCVSLRGKLVHATTEKTMLMQDVAYLTSRLGRTKLSEKMIEEDLSQVDEYVTRSIYKLGLGYERCEDKGLISTKFEPSSTYKDEEETLKVKQIPYPPNPKPYFNPKRAQKQTTNPSMPNLDGVYIFMFCGRAGHLDEFCFWQKRMEKRRVEYARNSYQNEFIDFCLTFLLVHRLIFLTDLTIAHMVLFHERVALCLHTLVSTHVLIVVLAPHVDTVLLLEVPILTLSRDALTVHAFAIVVHASLTQTVRCIRLW
jgi:hypothetical protein